MVFLPNLLIFKICLKVSHFLIFQAGRPGLLRWHQRAGRAAVGPAAAAAGLCAPAAVATETPRGGHSGGPDAESPKQFVWILKMDKNGLVMFGPIRYNMQVVHS